MSLVEALTVSLDNILWFAGIVAEAAVVWLLLYKRVWRTLPVFASTVHGLCSAMPETI